MASRNFDATGDPRSLESALSLTVGTSYYVQNVDPVASLRIRAAAVKPAATARAHIIAAGGSIVVEPEANVSNWGWTDDEACAVIVTENPS